MNRHSHVVALPISEAPAAIAVAAEAWGADWSGGRDGGKLVLPVVFGLRQGVLVGRVGIEPSGDGSRLTWELEDSRLELRRGEVALLALTLLLLLPALAWPFAPRLLKLLPLAAVTGLAAWWLVISKLRNSGPEEFFASVGDPEPAPR